ncbi:hypothetical protein Gohar_028041, partial [Gossypium harknessii]|nr:hypothetical protein [Gossypium harknessii]
VKRIAIAIIVWAIWNVRNKFYTEGSNQRVEELITFIQGYWVELGVIVSQMKHPNPQAERNNYYICSTFAAKALTVVHGLQFAIDLGNGNQTAHAMASKGMLRRGETFWVEDALSLTLNRDATGRRCMDPP